MIDNRLIEKLLKLPETRVIDYIQDENSAKFIVEMRDKPKICPNCGSLNPRLRVQQHKKDPQEVRDLSVHDQRTGLVLNRTKYRCMECDTTFWEKCDFINERAKMTTRLRNYIARQAERRPFSEIEKELDISDTTVLEIFREHIADLPNYQELETPEVLAIDEVHMHKTYRGIICNGDEHTLMDLLENRDKKTIIDYLRHLKDPYRVRIVTMDMWKPYRDAVYQVLPDAYVVIDEFHVVKKANEALDTYRRSLKKRITAKSNKNYKKQRFVLLRRPKNLTEHGKDTRDKWLADMPTMKRAYDLKEDLFDMYKCASKEEAQEHYRKWKAKAEKVKPFKALADTIDNCYREVFNYFDGYVTNAIAEGVVSHIRVIYGDGRGYGFDILRAKALFFLNHKIVRPRFGEGTLSNMLSRGPSAFNFFDDSDEPPKDYGVSEEVLAKAINAGFFN